MSSRIQVSTGSPWEPVVGYSRWEEISRAHGEVFQEIRPVATMVEVSALIDPALLVEVEAQAIIDNV